MNFRKHKSVPTLSGEIEAQILQNILSKCGKQSNTVSLETLDSYANYRHEKYLLLRSFIIVILIAFLLLPLLFLWPEVTVKERTDIVEYRRAWNIDVRTVVPIRTVTAVMDGRTVPIYEVAGTQYLVLPNANGVMDICVTLKNGQQTNTQIEVTGVDIEAPRLVSTDYDESHFFVTVEDDSEIDSHSITLTNLTGTEFPIAGYTEDPFTIILDYPKESMILTVADCYGHILKVDLEV